MARPTSVNVKELVNNIEGSDQSALPLLTLSPDGYKNKMMAKKKKETVVPIPDKNTAQDKKNPTEVLAKQALDTALSAPSIKTPPIERISFWNKNYKKIGWGGLGGIVAIIGTLFAVLAYLNDICVFPKCEENKGPPKPCWDNDVDYINKLGIDYNILHGKENKKDTIQECELSCKRYADQGCRYWSYNKEEEWCSLKSEIVDVPLYKNHYISGGLGCKVPTNFMEITHAYNKNISLST